MNTSAPSISFWGSVKPKEKAVSTAVDGGERKMFIDMKQIRGSGRVTDRNASRYQA